MASAECEICFKTFDHGCFTPKVLRCGHTLCSNCLALIFNDERPPNCPFCQAAIPMNLNPPTNFALQNDQNETFANKLDSLKKNFSIIIARTTRNMNRISSRLGPHDPDVWKTEKKVFGRFNSSLNVYQNLAYSYLGTDFQPTFSLRHFGNENLFFYKIALKVISEESIYVSHLVEGKMMYGKITCDNKHVFFHALTLSRIEGGASVVSLLDVKEYARKRKFYYFFEFETSKLIVPIEGHLLGINLIEHFPGETRYYLNNEHLNVSDDPFIHIYTEFDYMLKSFEIELKKFSSDEVSHASRPESLDGASNLSEPSHVNRAELLGSGSNSYKPSHARRAESLGSSNSSEPSHAIGTGSLCIDSNSSEPSHPSGTESLGSGSSESSHESRTGSLGSDLNSSEPSRPSIAESLDSGLNSSEPSHPSGTESFVSGSNISKPSHASRTESFGSGSNSSEQSHESRTESLGSGSNLSEPSHAIIAESLGSGSNSSESSPASRTEPLDSGSNSSEPSHASRTESLGSGLNSSEQSHESRTESLGSDLNSSEPSHPSIAKSLDIGSNSSKPSHPSGTEFFVSGSNISEPSHASRTESLGSGSNSSEQSHESRTVSLGSGSNSSEPSHAIIVESLDSGSISSETSHPSGTESLGSGSNSSEPTGGNISPNEIVLTMRSSKNFNIHNCKNRKIYDKIIERLSDISSADFTMLVRNLQNKSNILDCGLALPY